MARGNLDNDMESIVRAAVKNSIEEYADIIWNIANDIYDSCIELYYATYTPTVYKRHGNMDGFNLYRANGFDFDEVNMILDDFDGGNPQNLLKYGSKNDVREEVLAAVLSGQRGITVRPSPPAKFKWPRGWTASYPNKYSKYRYWSSGAHTIEEIIDDFEENILNDTSDLLERIMNKQKQQSPNVEKDFSIIGIAEKWEEIMNRWKDRWKDIPPIDDSIAPWPRCRGFNEENQSDKSKTIKSN